MEKYYKLALDTIDNQKQVAIDLAQQHGKTLDQVKNLRWFILEVADELSINRG